MWIPRLSGCTGTLQFTALRSNITIRALYQARSLSVPHRPPTMYETEHSSLLMPSFTLPPLGTTWPPLSFITQKNLWVDVYLRKAGPFQRTKQPPHLPLLVDVLLHDLTMLCHKLHVSQHKLILLTACLDVMTGPSPTQQPQVHMCTLHNTHTVITRHHWGKPKKERVNE